MAMNMSIDFEILLGSAVGDLTAIGTAGSSIYNGLDLGIKSLKEEDVEHVTRRYSGAHPANIDLLPLIKSGEIMPFTGWLSVYGNIDDGREVVVKGAFQEDNGTLIPLFLQHNNGLGTSATNVKSIGMGLVEDNEKGVRLYGFIDKELPYGREVARSISMGYLNALSPGFLVRRVDKEIKDGVTHINKGKLLEGSVVAFPMNSQARIAPVINPATAGNNSTKGADGADIGNLNDTYRNVVRDVLMDVCRSLPIYGINTGK